MRFALPVVLLAVVALTGCTSTVAGPEEDGPLLSNASGVVEEVSEGLFVIRVDRPRETVVVPTSLPEALRQDGLRVVFSGELQPIPPNVRMIGQPIELSRIAPVR